MKNDRIKVTELELAILQRIWSADNLATVNDIIDQWHEPDRPGYTTVLKTLQKMEDKEIVGHESQGRKYAYFAKITREQVANKRLRTLVDRVFGGDQISFAHYFINSEEIDTDTLNTLKEMIAQKERELKQ